MANEQSIFFKTPKKIKKEARETIKGSYAKCIKANLFGLAILLAVALGFTLSLLLLYKYEWLQITLCSILAVLFVFFAGTVIVGNCMFYTKLYKDDASIKDAFASFNNIWKYGRMFLYKVLLCLLFFVLSAGLILVVLIFLNSNLFSNFSEGYITFIDFIETCAKKDSFTKVIIIASVLGALSSLWAIIKAIKHSILFVSVAVFPKQTLTGAYKTSKKAIKGNKLRFVKLWFSLFPHYLICILTGGLYLLWFIPYYQTCKVIFYEDLVAEF